MSNISSFDVGRYDTARYDSASIDSSLSYLSNKNLKFFRVYLNHVTYDFDSLKNVIKYFSTGINFSSSKDTLKLLIKVLSANINYSDSKQVSVSKILSELIDYVSSNSKDIDRTFVENIDYEVVLNKVISKLFSEGIIFDVNKFKDITKTLSSNINYSSIKNLVFIKEIVEEVIYSGTQESISVNINESSIDYSGTKITKKMLYLKQMLEDFKKINVDDPFDLSVVLNDFKKVVVDLPNASTVTWIRYERTEDEFGRSSLDTESWSKSINLVVQPLTEKDREVSVSGEQINSYMKAYCEPSFYVDGTFGVQGIKTGDFITYKTKQYLVEKVAGKFGGSDEVFRKVIMKAVDND